MATSKNAPVLSDEQVEALLDPKPELRHVVAGVSSWRAQEPVEGSQYGTTTKVGIGYAYEKKDGSVETVATLIPRDPNRADNDYTPARNTMRGILRMLESKTFSQHAAALDLTVIVDQSSIVTSLAGDTVANRDLARAVNNAAKRFGKIRFMYRHPNASPVLKVAFDIAVETVTAEKPVLGASNMSADDYADHKANLAEERATAPVAASASLDEAF